MPRVSLLRFKRRYHKSQMPYLSVQFRGTLRLRDCYLGLLNRLFERVILSLMKIRRLLGR